MKSTRSSPSPSSQGSASSSVFVEGLHKQSSPFLSWISLLRPFPHGSASSSLDHASSHPGTSVLKDEDQTTTWTRTGRGHGLGALYGDQRGGGGGGGGGGGARGGESKCKQLTVRLYK